MKKFILVNIPALKGRALGKRRGCIPLTPLRIHPCHEWRGILRDSHKPGTISDWIKEGGMRLELRPKAIFG